MNHTFDDFLYAYRVVGAELRREFGNLPVAHRGAAGRILRALDDAGLIRWGDDV